MRTSLRLAGAITGVVSAIALATAAPAQALDCAPDPFEADTMLTGAPIAPGQTLTRAICQDPATDSDMEWFTFDAPGGKAYTASITSGGSALGVGELNGLQVAGVWRIEPDGTETVIDSPGARDFEQFTTPVLPAGRYVFVAANHDQVTYPDFYARLKTIEGAAGIYTMRLVTAAPAPSLASFTVPALRGNTRSTGTVTLSSPAPAGGTYVDFRPSGAPYISIPRAWVPAGATRANFTINVGRVTQDARVTITAFTAVGASKTVTTTVRRG